MYIGRYVYTFIYICQTYLQEHLRIFKWSVFTEHLQYISSTWISEHRCLLYRWRSWLNHAFCPGAENKPTFRKFPYRAFFCCSALPPSVLFLWLWRIKLYQHSSTWDIAMLMAIRPRLLVHKGMWGQIGQVFPSFHLHTTDIWFAPTSLSHLFISLHQCGDNSRWSATTYPKHSAPISLDLPSALTKMQNLQHLILELETVEATKPSCMGDYGCACKYVTVRLQQAGHLVRTFPKWFSLYLGMCLPLGLACQQSTSSGVRPGHSILGYFWEPESTWAHFSHLGIRQLL